MGRGLLGDLPDVVFLGVLHLVIRYRLKVTKAVFDGIGAATAGGSTGRSSPTSRW